ncbi:MAG: two-component system capsular synthesis response regulator RcsB [Flavobacterium sp.]|jgi:two-component system capsular synthesis response regulator RcsB
MFKKVLIAEDLDSISLAVHKTIQALEISEIVHVKYCDDAILKIKKAVQDNQPFDLLLTDLSFKSDHRKTVLSSGEDLIQNAKKLQPNLKVLVYSVEDKTFRIKHLFDNLNINAFVLKGRKSLKELETAIPIIFKENTKYISPEMGGVLLQKSAFEIDDFDIQLIKQLSLGIAQDRMELRFKELGIVPNSKSSIEKRLGKLKDHFKANNTVHLIAIAKDLGIT